MRFNSRGPFWDNNSDYFSVVRTPGDSVEVMVDPSAYPSEAGKPGVRSIPAVVGEIAEVYTDVEAREREIGLLYHQLSEAGAVDSVSFQAYEASLREIRAPILERIESTPKSLLRQWLLMRFFDELVPAGKYSF